MDLIGALTGIVERLTDWRRYLALYPAVVARVLSDGTLEVIPDDAAMRGSGLRARYLSGSAAGGGLPLTRDRVLLGFEGGNPERPFAIACAPSAALTEVAAVASKTQTALDALATTMAAHVHTSAAPGSPTTPSTNGTVVIPDVTSDFPVRLP